MTGLSYSPNGAHLAVGLASGEVQVFDIESNTSIFTLQSHHEVGRVHSSVPTDKAISVLFICSPLVSCSSVCTGLLRGRPTAGSWSQEWTDTDLERFAIIYQLLQ